MNPKGQWRRKITAQMEVLRSAFRLVDESGRRWLVLHGFCILGQAAFPVASLYLVKLLVDTISNGGRWSAIEQILCALGATLLAAQLVRAYGQYVIEAQALDVVEHVQRLLHRKSMEATLEYYENPAFRDTLHRAQQEAPHRPLSIVRSLIQIAQGVLSLIFVAALVFSTTHWWLILVLGGLSGPLLLQRIRHSHKIFEWNRAHTSDERRADYYHWMLTSPAFAKEMRLYGLGHLFEQRAAETRTSLNRARRRFAVQRMFSDAGAQAIMTGLIVAAVSWMARRSLSGELSIGALVMQFQAFQRGSGLVHEIVGGIASLYENQLFLSRLQQFLNLRFPPPAAAPQSFPSRPSAHICFEDVTFSYEGAQEAVLKGINLAIAKGEMVAIVGANGAGKSTLIKLLCGLYTPTEGRVVLNGYDLALIEKEGVWSQMSVLFQDFNQYFVSARENIWFGDSKRAAKEFDIVQAAKAAGVDELIEAFPRGYDQLLGRLFEGGRDISVGQWQKLALSRAFFRDSEIILLDEPTSALDVRAEFDLFCRFKALTHGRTSVVISHRLSSVRMADRILLLQDGVIAEVGSHDELLSTGGLYADLFETQASAYR